MWTLLPSLCLFAFITAFTPGPNNFLLASSGSQFSLRQTWRHIVGIRVGVSGLILLSAAGVGVLLQAYPLAYTALKNAETLILGGISGCEEMFWRSHKWSYSVESSIFGAHSTLL